MKLFASNNYCKYVIDIINKMFKMDESYFDELYDSYLTLEKLLKYEYH